MFTLQKFRQANLDRCMTTKKFEKCVSWTASEWGLALAGEAGEVCNAIKKLNRGDGDTKSVVEEIGDVIIYADLLLAFLSTDMESTIVNKFNKVSDKVGSKIKL